MGYLNFDKNQLVNLSYSLNKEFLRTNKNGAYASSSIIACNTRKYHGLLVCPQTAIDDELHVLLSSIDVSIIEQGTQFNLGVHRYPNDVYQPKGHKYIESLNIKPPVEIIYSVGNNRFSVQTVFSKKADRIYLKYTLLDAKSEIAVQLKPFLAFRQRHSLSKANIFANKKYKKINYGVSYNLYQGYTDLNIQLNTSKYDYIHSPDWYYNIEYLQEKERGYDAYEDLLVPGFIELKMEKGDSVILAAGTKEISANYINRSFNDELKKFSDYNDFKSSLENAASSFIQKRNSDTEIIAGYHWFGKWGRDTLISLPGLCLSRNRVSQFKSIVNNLLKDSRDEIIPNLGSGENANYNSVDASLWLFWALQKFISKTDDYTYLKRNYYKKLKKIIENYSSGKFDYIQMHENGLLWAEKKGFALTWMDAIVNGVPVTQRAGYAVEINALWYNALKFTLELAEKFDDIEFLNNWKNIIEKIPQNFKSVFWSKEKGYLADVVYHDSKDWSVRPNMLFAASLPYNAISDKIRHLILQKIEKELLTERGLRTLSPKNPDYQGEYVGNQELRDSSYHQGTVWPWLMGHFVEAYLDIYGKSGLKKMEWHIERFEDVLIEHGVGYISEIYDGDPPHAARGTIAQAWSVAEVLRANKLIEDMNKNNKGL